MSNKINRYSGYIPGSRIGKRLKRHVSFSVDELTAMNIGNYVEVNGETLSEFLASAVNYYLHDQGLWFDFLIDIEEEIY